MAENYSKANEQLKAEEAAKAERKAAKTRLYVLQPDGYRSGHQAGGLLL